MKLIILASVCSLVDSAGKAEVANFQVTVCIYKQVARLDVSMHNIGRVEEKQSSKHLIHEVLVVLVR